MNKSYDFSGWATKNNLKCSDGRVIMRDAFKDNDGATVPLVWNHNHSDPNNVLGHALLENRENGVYAYCTFNNTESGETAKELVKHGDIVALSIYANKLKQKGCNVMHGAIREVSLVLAGANPGAYINAILAHGEDSDEEAIMMFYEEDDEILEHSDEKKEEDIHMENKDEKKTGNEETVGDVFNTLTEKQKTVVYAMIGQALEEAGANRDEEDDEEENGRMKHNVFDNEDTQDTVLCHADLMNIVELAKRKDCGSIQEAISQYLSDDDSLEHSMFSEEDLATLFPEFENLMSGAPEAIPENKGWVASVMNNVHKTPFSRIKTRQADIDGIKALGYNTKGSQKKDTQKIKLVSRTTDPCTVYIKNSMDRDDIVDITDFDPVMYQYNIMKNALKEEVATAILIGDGRDELDADKIKEDHIRPIWTDDELYTHHVDIDIAKAKAELQGTETNAHFGDNYVYAEAVIEATLYAREKYKGSGDLTLYCAPHLLNVMLLARDINGRRIYNSKSDLQAALNVKAIETIEKFDGKTRKTADEMPKTKKLLGLFVNLDDYNVGATKKGEITNFHDFDLDFNKEKFLIETRLSGALTRVASAIALEEDVTA